MHADPIINNHGEIEKAGCIVLNDRDEILLVTNVDRSAWGLPKGHAEKGESPVDVARRETREETGYDVEIVRTLGDMTYVNQQIQMPIRVHYFLAKPISRGEKAEEAWEWVNIKEAKKLVLPNVSKFLELVLSQIT